ncbi:MAG: M14 metallopeptidase family protein [Bacteroidota bacterium]
MKRLLLLLWILTGVGSAALAQLKSPDEYLGYPLGSRFTFHDRVIDYFKYVAEQRKQIKLVNYGKTYEGRELLVAVVSAKDNIDKLEEIRQQNLNLSKGKKSGLKSGKQPVILWLSYNIHGNEASSSETAMKMLYDLAEGKTKGVQEWLTNTVVIIDPCLNPDGRERYVSYFNGISGRKPNLNPMAREHFEPWPGGRSNHYYFDLNRDWAWQTQIETLQRLKLYRNWMPEVHIDFHEQNYNDPYYFAPAAEPVHVDITPWQRTFQVIAGKNNAKYFDEYGWKYFTKERFDLLYPSYGDTYPLYNGAIGMTYEQGGIGAGLGVVTIDGDTLTLKDRIDHHFTTGMATLETVSAHADKLVDEFRLYFERSIANPPGVYRTYVVKAESLDKVKQLAALLTKNGISYAFGPERSLRGYNYESKKNESFKGERNDLVVNLQQPASVLANVLFEPQTEVRDSNTYDITAWALPYAYGLRAYALKESVLGQYPDLEDAEDPAPIMEKPYAWIFNWGAVKNASVLQDLQKANLKVRMAEEPFTVGTRTFPIGTLLVLRSENEKISKGITAYISGIAKAQKVTPYSVASGYVNKGKDLGSSVYTLLTPPKIGIVAGPGTSSQGVGEVWHFLEQELNHAVTMFGVENLENLDINKINVLIMADGSYDDELGLKLESWIRRGGKLILMENAITAFAGKKPFGIKFKETDKEEDKSSYGRRYGLRSQDDLANIIPGAIFKVDLDRSHPLAAGLGNCYYTLKTDDKIYEPFPKDWNVGLLKPNSHLSGVAGTGVLKKLNTGMLFGVQKLSKGSIIYLGSDILFRSFWENGKQMFLNAVFLVD